jgi:hypothetical protein
MKILIPFVFICLFSINMYATTSCGDTTIPQKSYRISQQQFLDSYGKDDTAREIINYYFKKRMRARKDIIVMGSIAMVSGLLFIVFAETNSAYLAFFVAGLAGAAIWTFAFTLLTCMYRWFHFSRKRLWKSLNKYLSGGSISKKLKRKLHFQKY